MMVRGQFAQIMAPGMHKIFNQFTDLVQREREYDKIFNVATSEDAFEDEIEFAGLGPMPEKTEGDSIMYQSLIQGGTKRYLHLSYGLGCRASWELIEDDKYGVIKKAPEAIVRSGNFTREMTIMNVLNLGFSLTTTFDGKTLFNNQHPLLGGIAATNVAPGVTNIISASGTYPNRPATDVDFGFTALQLMANQFERMPDATGFPIKVKPKLIVIPPELKFIAREILGSPGKPYTGDNEINSIIGEDLTYFVSHYTTSQSAWFVLADKANHQLKVKIRKEFDADYDDDFDTRSTKQVEFGRWSAGASSWIGTWGSNGP